MSAEYANAIVMKTTPIIMKTKGDGDDTGKNGSGTGTGEKGKKPLLDANGKPVLDANGNPIYVDENGVQYDSKGTPINANGSGSGSGAKESQTQSQEHKLILEKEKVIEDLIRQYNQQTSTAIANGSSPEEARDKNIAVDFFLKMMKTYFALVLKFGDTVANTVIRMTMPAQIANPIISDTPLNIADLLKTADRVNQVLANPDFKTEVGSMFQNTSNVVSPQIKMLLNKMADIIGDIAEKAGSKLANTAAITVSGAFPPLAVIFDIANLISVGINAVTSGVSAVSTAANSGAKVVGAFNSVPSVNMDKYMANTTEKTTDAKTDAKAKANTIPKNTTKKLKGGGIKEIGVQVLHGLGGDFIIETGDKIKNAFYNGYDTIKPEIDNLKLKAMRYTLNRDEFRKQVGGARHTKRAIDRIQKTLHDYDNITRVSRGVKSKRTKRRR
jgi:flagellar motor protein MotB